MVVSPPPASGSNAPTVIDIQAVVDLNTYPFVVLEGSIRGNLYTAPGTGWKVTSGYFGTPNSRYPFSLFIEAEASPLGNAATAARPVLPAGTVHQKISIVCALSELPNAFPGYFFLDDEAAFFGCTVLFKGWQPCW